MSLRLGMDDAEEENLGRGVGGTHSTPLGPLMDILSFERDRPRWWIRRCEQCSINTRWQKERRLIWLQPI